MTNRPLAHRIIAAEAESLLTRLDRVKPFSLQMPAVAAAAIPGEALVAIERYLARGRRNIRRAVSEFLDWLHGPAGSRSTPKDAHRRLVILRLKFNAALSQFVIFAEVLSQRCEHDTGVWLAGLDAVAGDAIRLPQGFYEPPPVVCFLERGFGAAIRRIKTRLPGGGRNPVAVIQIPRERMIGSAVASSLIHEVGHQGSALLGLPDSLGLSLKAAAAGSPRDGGVWRTWERWRSEILADLWSVARLGAASTLGLMNVVSLPRPFVFRISSSDPHPAPWIRVKLSCAMGNALYPHRQWNRLAALWQSFYPLEGARAETARVFRDLERSLPAFVEHLLGHRPSSLRGLTVCQALRDPDRRPERLAALFRQWSVSPARMRAAAPTLAFAVLGQAKLDGTINPRQESVLLGDLLARWALHGRIGESVPCNLRSPAELDTGIKTFS